MFPRVKGNFKILTFKDNIVKIKTSNFKSVFEQGVFACQLHRIKSDFFKFWSCLSVLWWYAIWR